LAALKRWLLRRALARAAAELGGDVRRDDGWLRGVGLTAQEVDALADELRRFASSSALQL
jgi:hypothetical protein